MVADSTDSTGNTKPPADGTGRAEMGGAGITRLKHARFDARLMLFWAHDRGA